MSDENKYKIANLILNVITPESSLLPTEDRAELVYNNYLQNMDDRSLRDLIQSTYGKESDPTLIRNLFKLIEDGKLGKAEGTKIAEELAENGYCAFSPEDKKDFADILPKKIQDSTKPYDDYLREFADFIESELSKTGGIVTKEALTNIYREAQKPLKILSSACDCINAIGAKQFKNPSFVMTEDSYNKIIKELEKNPYASCLLETFNNITPIKDEKGNLIISENDTSDIKTQIFSAIDEEKQRQTKKEMILSLYDRSFKQAGKNAYTREQTWRLASESFKMFDPKWAKQNEERAQKITGALAANKDFCEKALGYENMNKEEKKDFLKNVFKLIDNSDAYIKYKDTNIFLGTPFSKMKTVFDDKDTPERAIHNLDDQAIYLYPNAFNGDLACMISIYSHERNHHEFSEFIQKNNMESYRADDGEVLVRQNIDSESDGNVFALYGIVYHTSDFASKYGAYIGRPEEANCFNLQVNVADKVGALINRLQKQSVVQKAKEGQEKAFANARKKAPKKVESETVAVELAKAKNR